MDSSEDKTGLDDYLVQFVVEDRSRAMAKLIRRADNKPADSTPGPSPAGEEAGDGESPTGDRKASRSQRRPEGGG